jgi:hypothetical protein
MHQPASSAGKDHIEPQQAQQLEASWCIQKPVCTPRSRPTCGESVEPICQAKKELSVVMKQSQYGSTFLYIPGLGCLADCLHLAGHGVQAGRVNVNTLKKKKILSFTVCHLNLLSHQQYLLVPYHSICGLLVLLDTCCPLLPQHNAR